MAKPNYHDLAALSNSSEFQDRCAVAYTDGSDKFQEVYRTPRALPDWPDSIMRQRLEELNGLDEFVASLTTGPAKDKPEAKVEPKTQEQLDREAFAVLCSDYRTLTQKIDAQTALKVDLKVSQSDLDSKVAEIKNALSVNPDFEPMIRGLF